MLGFISIALACLLFCEIERRNVATQNLAFNDILILTTILFGASSQDNYLPPIFISMHKNEDLE